MEATINFILNGVNYIPKCGNRINLIVKVFYLKTFHNIVMGFKFIKFYSLIGQPGSLIVFDHNAHPILTADDSSSVVFAAAQVGAGRVFITSHEAYIHHFMHNTHDFGRLWSNIKNWLYNTDGSVEHTNDQIGDIENYELVEDIPSQVKLLKWIGTQNKTELFTHQLLKKYVQTGGSIICGICPWGSYSKHIFIITGGA